MTRLARNHATSLVLVALALGLGGYLLIVDRGKPTSDELDARKANLFPVLRRDELTRISIDRDGRRVSIVRRGSPDASDEMFYFVADGIDEPADQMAVEQLLQAVEFAKRLRKVGPDVDRGQTGLDSPRLRLTIEMGKITYALALGAETRTPRGAAFVDLGGEGVLVASADFVRAVLGPIDAYRSHTVLPYTSSRLAAITLDGAGGRRRFVRAAWGGFRLEDGPRIDQTVFDRMLAAFASISAEHFVADSAADTALAPPEARVTITLEPKDASDPTAIIDLGGACPIGAEPDSAAPNPNLAVAIRRKPTRLSACVPASVLDDLRAPYEAFVDHRVIDARDDEIEEIVLAQGDRAIEMARADQGWHLRRPEDRTVTSAEAAGFVQGILQMRGDLVTTDRKAAGLDPPQGSLVVRTHGKGDEGQQEQKVLIGGIVGDHDVVVVREQDGRMLRIPPMQARALVPSIALLRSTTLLDVPASAVQSVEIRRDGKPWQTVKRSDAGFDLIDPQGFEADGALASDLMASLATLRADRWVADRDDGTFGLDKPRLEVRFDVMGDAGVQSWRLLVGNELPDGVFARWEPDTGVFVLPRAVEDTLLGLVVDRSAIAPAPAEVRTVTLSAGTRKVTLVASGEQWTPDADAGVWISEASAARVQRAIAELRPERAIHTGGPLDAEGFSKPTVEILVRRQPGDGGRLSDVRIRFGRADVWRSMNVFYARREGVDATFVVAASKVQPLIDALGGGAEK